ncbi:unnamed protein product [Cuscuta europaea]|uniref:HRDC domain-containing protein n=1 Tax=Cuscuta europaea TaxID=41803 RepID=A0A9P1EA52_CUSEU|nr:unnamed protein product [Cuscuta europaea]
MEKGDRVKVAALTLASCVTLAIYFFLASKLHQRKRPSRRNPSSSPPPCYLRAEPKPQYDFKRVLADNSYSHFQHLSLHPADTSTAQKCTSLHPYMTEISALLKESNVKALEKYNENLDELKSRGSYVWVETGSQLQELAEVLSGERIFGVDVEHDSVRSFLGLTCLVQISTKREDYLVDAIALHDLMGILRPIFADPGICKVFHGADNDVLWLQRDFHIYVVNLFDTAKACHVLSKPQNSLAYLLKTYCGVITNKQLRREDWRQRPLPEEMLHYAKKDSHYLMYIACCVYKELKIQDLESSPCLNNKLTFVLEATSRSNATCLQLFSKVIEAYPGYSAASSIISRCHRDQGNLPSNFVNAKFHDLVSRLCAWRDIMARVHDESLRYVLSDQALVALAAKAPTDVRDIRKIISESHPSEDHISSSQSPSSLACSHMEDFISHLFQDEIGEDEESLLEILQKCLGVNGSCPLSAYNIALLSESSLEVADRSVVRNKSAKSSLARKALQELFDKTQHCKSPVYDNCRIYTSDGRFLSFCARRKLEWYLKKNLARLVEEDPPAIMLMFEPKRRPEDEDKDFCYENKQNVCVRCGEGDRYLRYRIIPLCYIKHFPEHFNSYRYHNLVLLCVDCHEIARVAGERYKEKIAEEIGIPLFVSKDVDGSSQNKKFDMKHPPPDFAASDNNNQESNSDIICIPVVSENGNISTESDLVVQSDESVSSEQLKESMWGHGPHGKRVVESILKEHGDEGIREFIQRWRESFVEAIHPRFLPARWNSKHMFD